VGNVLAESVLAHFARPHLLVRHRAAVPPPLKEQTPPWVVMPLMPVMVTTQTGYCTKILVKDTEDCGRSHAQL